MVIYFSDSSGSRMIDVIVKLMFSFRCSSIVVVSRIVDSFIICYMVFEVIVGIVFVCGSVWGSSGQIVVIVSVRVVKVVDIVRNGSV